MDRLIRIQRTVLLVGILLMLAKTAAYFITGSNAILTDALESLVNIAAGTIALYSLLFSFKPRDREHPYGHGKIEFVSAGLEGGMILVAGLIIIIKAGYNLVYPQTIQNLDTGLILAGSAGLVNFIMGIILIRKGKEHNVISMEADGRHLLSDAYTTIGLFIGLGLVIWTGKIWLDNVVAIAFGLLLSYTGIKIIRKSLAGILDEADMKLLDETVGLLEKNRRPSWIDLHNLRIIKYGSIYHLDCHVTLPWYYDIRKAHQEIEAMEQVVKNQFGDTTEMFIHNDPCRAESCKICSLDNCEKRQHPKEQKMIWTLENVLKNKQHTMQSKHE
jgi:cation diffusion facilitator family transporter